jgi:hypothetical protein
MAAYAVALVLLAAVYAAVVFEGPGLALILALAAFVAVLVAIGLVFWR